MLQRQCKICNSPFKTWPYSIRNGHGLYCSRKCAEKGKWQNPTQKMLDHVKKAQAIMAKSRIGLKHSIKTRKLISKNTKGKNLGENNPRWNGGISVYKRFVSIKKCEDCDSKRNLIVHHKDKNRHNNLLNNLKVICYRCHYKEHKGFNRWERHLKLPCLICGKTPSIKGLCRYHYQINYMKTYEK